MTAYSIADSLHRLVKQAVDSGAAATIADAEAMFRQYRVSLCIGASEADDAMHQAALLTGVALARRVFLGGVYVGGSLNVPLRVPLFSATTLDDAVRNLGGIPASLPDRSPRISIGSDTAIGEDAFHVRAVFSGWRGGIIPGHQPATITNHGDTMPLAAMLAAALAVNEGFQYVGRNTPAAGRRSVGLSLWNPGNVDWLDRSEPEPTLRYLPSQLWLIGLGHLGQAYLWALGLLPYPRQSGLRLVLQDNDRFTPSSESTCILSDFASVGMRKTRALAAWAEERGFETIICERLFDSSFRRQNDEPAVALCGIDNSYGRRALDQAGFDLVVEAGLGMGHLDFRRIRMHTLPGPRVAHELWKAGAAQVEYVQEIAAYRNLLNDGTLDKCGVTLLAGKAVGAPFVGSVAACLVVSEVLRHLHGGPTHDVIEMDLQSVDYRSAVVSACTRQQNTGFVKV